MLSERPRIAENPSLALSVRVSHVTLIGTCASRSGGQFRDVTVLDKAWRAVRLLAYGPANPTGHACAFLAHRSSLFAITIGGFLMALA